MVTATRQGTGQGACTAARKVADEVAVKAAHEMAVLVPREAPRIVTSEAMRVAAGEAWEGSGRRERIED